MIYRSRPIAKGTPTPYAELDLNDLYLTPLGISQ